MKSIYLAAAFACIAGSVSAETIGVTIARSDSVFLTILRQGIEDQAKKLGVTVQVEDAQNDPSKQLNQVQNFVASGVDSIIVIAVDGDATPAMTKLAADKGIAIAYANHPPADVDQLPDTAAFVGSDEKQSGTIQTEEVCKLLGGKGNIFVLMGPLNNHSSLVRTQDIEDVIAKEPCQGITIIEKQSANWDRLEANNIMTNWLSAGQAFDGVIANNDEMAIGAIQAMKSASVDQSKVVVAGIDATPDGLAAMKAGDLDVTVFQNAIAQGAAAVDAVLAINKKQQSERHIWVPFELVTPQNLEDYSKANQ